MKQKEYLGSMRKGIDQIIGTMSIFKEEIKIKEKDLENYLVNTKQFNFQFRYPIQERGKIQLLKVKDELEKQRNKINYDKFPPNIHHEITVRYFKKKFILQ